MNKLGQFFSVTSFGESHGAVVGCVLDACPANITINIEEIQQQVNRRKASNSLHSTTRLEEDTVEILSGIKDGKTLGSPIAISIKNNNTKASDYAMLENVYRPNHVDYTNEMKYGIRDVLGGGRSSIRVTAPLVAAGDIARQFLQQKINYTCTGYVSNIGGIGFENRNDYSQIDFAQIEVSEVKCPDVTLTTKMKELLETTAADGDTLGGIITCVVKLDTVGIGEPIFNKLQAQLAHAMLSINTVKGFEYGMGFESANQKGSNYNDSFEIQNGEIKTTSNHSGGIQGGISNGMDIYFHVAFKPISSIKKEQKTVTKNKEEIHLQIQGRHDVCAVPRAVAIVEAYTNIIMADMYIQHLINK